MFKALFHRIANIFVTIIGRVSWPSWKQISNDDRAKIHDLLVDNYFIILTRHSSHLSTYSIAFADWCLTGKFGYWAHALLNLEDQVQSDKDFRLVEMHTVIDNNPQQRDLIEATSVGVHFSPFEDVFVGIQGVALLKPKCMTLAEWTGALDAAKVYLGRPYDTLFNLADDQQLSCVELVRDVLKTRPNYAEEFKNLEAFIAKYKNLTPQMYYDCGDFEVVFEARV